jgi:hypothetical protein
VQLCAQRRRLLAERLERAQRLVRGARVPRALRGGVVGDARARLGGGGGVGELVDAPLERVGGGGGGLVVRSGCLLRRTAAGALTIGRS